MIIKTKKILPVLAITVALLSGVILLSPFSSAQAATFGNNAISRGQIDSASNFTVIDANNSVSNTGNLTSITYYAANTNPVRFVVVNNANVVQWVSPAITPSVVGVNTYTPVSPVPVQAGWNLGVYFSSTGSIPFDMSGSNASWTAVDSGVPTVGMTLTSAGTGARTYSVMGNVTVTPILNSLVLSPSSGTLNVGATQQLTPNAKDQNNSVFSGANVTYLSSNPAVATVNSSGLVTGVSAGTATITATATSGSTSVNATSNFTITNQSTPQPSGNFYLGNDVSTTRSQVDSYSNFTIVDTNNPASHDGNITEIDYYASNMNPFHLLLVNGSNVVQWMSPLITPSVIGINAYMPTSPIPVQTGWNLGAHFESTGTIPFASTGKNAMWTANNSGAPTVGMTLTSAGTGARTYSFVAVAQNAQPNDNDNNMTLRIRIILNMIRRLLAQIGITSEFTAPNGWTF